MKSPVLKIFASLRLTVALLGCAMILVFAGTLAQVELGLWEAQKRFFQTWIVFSKPEKGGFSFPVLPGGYLLGWILVINLLAAHYVRFKFSVKKIGIMMIHFGILLLLLGQFFTELWQVESVIRLAEGESTTYSESTQLTELAITESKGEREEVVTISQKALAGGGEIRDEQLPFTVRVKEWMPNSDPKLLSRNDGKNERARTELRFKATPVTRKMNEVNLPSAELEIVDEGTVVGSWFVSTYLSNQQAKRWLKKWAKENFGTELGPSIDPQQAFNVGGRNYEISLRPVRYYKFTRGGNEPFKITLLDFRHDLYEGTAKAKNFSSRIRIENPATGENRETLIYMNNPLRYAGETYYQLSFDPEREDVTVLQVVRNPVWLSPYVACLLVSAGLLVHFGMHLVGSAKGRRGEEISKPNPAAGLPAIGRLLWLRRVLVLSVGLWAGWQLFPGPDNTRFELKRFGKLPVLVNGRVQPIDSMARNALLMISGKSVLRVNSGKEKMTATEWVLEAMTKPEEADQRKIFRLENVELRALLNAREGRFGFVSFEELKPQLTELEKEARLIARHKKEAQLRTGYERDLVHLFESVILFQRIKNTLQPEATTNFVTELHGLTNALGRVLPAFREGGGRSGVSETDLAVVSKYFDRFQVMSNFSYAHLLPVDQGWEQAGSALLESIRSGAVVEEIWKWAALSSAYRTGNAQAFNSAVVDYESWLATKGFGNAHDKAGNEAWFNSVEFFYKATTIYVVTMLLGALSWIKPLEGMRSVALAILLIGFSMHTVGLGLRMILEGRPPVTNLYSSAVFIGWGSVLFGLMMERIYRRGIGVVVAGIIGFVTLIIAHHLSLSGDTMQMLEAVLDTNVWLATHVVIVVSGYSAMFVAGLLGIIYLARRLVAGSSGDEQGKLLARMAFGVVCFGTLFSFTGTVLGGIWADQSWGRFWGWDPKENGALLIVLWCALMLHARLGKIVQERGFMVMAVIGNVITSFSWFGVNMLGIGLHSYGFMEGAFAWLLAFCVSQVLVSALGLIPRRSVRPSVT